MKLIIKKRMILYFILLFPLLKINYFSHFPIFNAVYQMTLLMSFSYCAISYIKRKKLPSNYVWLFIFLEVWLIIQSYVNDGNVTETLRIARSLICMSFIMDLYSDDFESLLKFLYYYFTFFSIINLFLMILFPNGIYSVYSAEYNTRTVEWLFGVGNVSISWHYPAVVVAWCYSAIVSDKKYGWFMSIIALVTHIIDGSATTIVGILIILLLQNITLLKRILTPKIGCLLVAFMFFLVVIQQNFNFLEPFIVDFLGKDMTFTGRLVIWQNAVEAIIKNPVFGYGTLHADDAIKILGVIPNVDYLWRGATHCHDNYLQILLTGGLIAGIVYFLLYKSAIKQLSSNWRHPVSKVITSCLISFLIIQISEAFDNHITMYLVLILIVNTNKLIKCYEEKKKERIIHE